MFKAVTHSIILLHDLNKINKRPCYVCYLFISCKTDDDDSKKQECVYSINIRCIGTTELKSMPLLYVLTIETFSISFKVDLFSKIEQIW